MKSPALIFFLLMPLISLAQFSQKDSTERKNDVGLFVYDYEKIIDPFYNCEIFVATVNQDKKVLAVEIRDIFVFYEKLKVKEWIDGIQAVIEAKTGKVKNGKRIAIYLLSDGESNIYFDEKGSSVVKFGRTDKTIITQESARKILEGFKLAYEKL